MLSPHGWLQWSSNLFSFVFATNLTKIIPVLFIFMLCTSLHCYQLLAFPLSTFPSSTVFILLYLLCISCLVVMLFIISFLISVDLILVFFSFLSMKFVIYIYLKKKYLWRALFFIFLWYLLHISMHLNLCCFFFAYQSVNCSRFLRLITSGFDLLDFMLKCLVSCTSSGLRLLDSASLGWVSWT